MTSAIGWHRVIKCHFSMGHFPQKSPIIRGSLAKNDLQLKASYGSSPLCIRILKMCSERSLQCDVLSFPAIEPLREGLFCGKWPIKIRHLMTLRQTVSASWNQILKGPWSATFCLAEGMSLLSMSREYFFVGRFWFF